MMAYNAMLWYLHKVKEQAETKAMNTYQVNEVHASMADYYQVEIAKLVGQYMDGLQSGRYDGEEVSRILHNAKKALENA